MPLLSRLVSAICVFVVLALYPHKAASLTLVLSGHHDYAPFSWVEDDELQGAAVELMQLVFADTQVTLEFTYQGKWGRVLQQARNGDVDILVGVLKTPERETYLAFSKEPYHRDPVVVFTAYDAGFSYETWQDLAPKLGGTTRGESFGAEFDQYAAANLRLSRLSNIQQAFEMLDKGRLDYVLYGLYPGNNRLGRMGLSERIKPMLMPLTSPWAYQAVSRKSDAVVYLPLIDEKIKILRENGTIAELVRKYHRRWQRRIEQQPNKTSEQSQ